MESTLPSFCWSYKIENKEATVTVSTVLVVMAVSVVTATPLNSTPFCRQPEKPPPKFRGKSHPPNLRVVGVRASVDAE